MGAFDRFIKAGAALFGSGDENNKMPNLEEEAELRFGEIQVERQIAENEYQQLKAEETELSSTIDEEQEAGNTSAAKARFEYLLGWLGIDLAVPMIATCVCLAYYSIAPGFYGREHIAYLICIGCGIAIAIAGHVLLEYLESNLNKSQFNRFVIYTCLLMLCLGMGGSILLSRARSLQWELQSHLNSDSALELQAKEQDTPIDIEELKRGIEKLTSRALIIWFLALDWIGAILLHLGVHRIRTNKPLVALGRSREKVKARIKQLQSRLAHLQSITKENILASLKAGFARESRRGRPRMLVFVTVVFLASIIGFIVLSETQAFGAEPPCHVLCALDVTGSANRDRRENERAILHIIDSLMPGDSLQVMLITEATFSDPSYLLDAKLPEKAGYFKEEVLRAKKQVIREFRSKAQKLSESRCATSLFDGIYLFSELLKEHPAKRKVLVLLSDMQQTAGGINPDKLARDGTKILSQLKADGLVPDMRGIEVHVLGVSTHGINLRAWAKLKAFWKKYFSATGCELRAFAVGRNFTY